MIKFTFFGSSRLSTIVLDELARLNLVPHCIVTTPDKPQGRNRIVTPNVVKRWAIDHDIKVFDPIKLDSTFAEILKREECQVFIVASFGKIIPPRILEIPKHQTLNIHPSLLPKYRGPSPLPSTMIDDQKTTGITIMLVDQEMDHGPIVAQKQISISEWPIYEEFEEMMARAGAELLAEVLPKWLAGDITAQPQDHTAATFTQKITKDDGFLNLTADPYLNFRKIQAYHAWPVAYFFLSHNGKKIRIKITSAAVEGGKLVIKKVIPEGGHEISYTDFKHGYGIK